MRKKMTTNPDAEEATMTVMPDHEISTETAEMTDAEAVETLVRTDEEHLSDDLPEQVTVDAEGRTLPGMTVQRTQGTNPPMFHVLSEIDDGVFVAWDFCRRDGRTISECTCKQGPQEPKYVTQWRLEHLSKRKQEFEKTMDEVSKKAKKELSELIATKLDERADAEETPVESTVESSETSEEETA